MNVIGFGFFPPESRERIDVSVAPKAVQEDYEESLRCFQTGAMKAAAAMARRAVQSACLDLGADPNGRLVEQIEALHKSGEFSNRLKALADKIRYFGNEGAHPDKDGLDKVGSTEVEQAIRFLEHLIEHVYTIDAELGSSSVQP